MLETLWGTSLCSRLLFGFAVCVIGGVFCTTFFTVLYQRFIYSKILRPGFNPAFAPRCAVIVPCKGITKDFEKNLRSFCELDFPDYEVVYTVESETDAAVEVIRKVTSEHSRASLVIAGLTKDCAQKNWNLVAAVNKAHNPEILVFADADISPRPEWIRELIAPLSTPKITVTTGFRWLRVDNCSFAQQLHFYMNSFLYTLYCFSSFTSNVGLWGGSMAIRKKEYDELGVAVRWHETVVDDSSLSQLVKKNGRKSMLVTTCITQTDDSITSVGAAIRWFERQMMFLKAYQKTQWLLSIPLIALALGLLVWLPVAVVVGLATTHSFLTIAGGASLVLVVGKFLSDMQYGLLGPMPKFGTFIVYQPLALGVFLFSCLRTAFTNTVTWSGYKYKVSFFTGKVTNVNRL